MSNHSAAPTKRDWPPAIPGYYNPPDRVSFANKTEEDSIFKREKKRYYRAVEKKAKTDRDAANNSPLTTDANQIPPPSSLASLPVNPPPAVQVTVRNQLDDNVMMPSDNAILNNNYSLQLNNDREAMVPPPLDQNNSQVGASITPSPMPIADFICFHFVEMRQFLRRV